MWGGPGSVGALLKHTAEGAGNLSHFDGRVKDNSVKFRLRWDSVIFAFRANTERKSDKLPACRGAGDTESHQSLRQAGSLSDIDGLRELRLRRCDVRCVVKFVDT